MHTAKKKQVTKQQVPLLKDEAVQQEANQSKDHLENVHVE